jgi:hypothetical protein
MTDTQRNDDQWYIAATTPPTQEVIRTLKHGDTFGVFDCLGDIGQSDTEEQGFYHNGTRFLSQWALRIDGGRPMLLGSIAREDNSLLIVDLTTPDIYRGDERVVPKGSVHISRNADHRDAGRPLPSCRNSLVQHALRPRWADYRLANPLGQSRARQGRVRLSGRPSGGS